MKVIIISPEENTLTFFEKVLKDLDIDLTYETSLASSVELMHKEHFDVVILDSSFRKSELIHTIGKIDRKKVTFILVLLGPHDEIQRELILKKLNADYSINHGEDDEYRHSSSKNPDLAGPADAGQRPEKYTLSLLNLATGGHAYTRTFHRLLCISRTRSVESVFAHFCLPSHMSTAFPRPRSAW